MANDYDVIVVGGGYAGLSVAALLARQQKRVLLLERAERLGGRATYYEKDGLVWEYGQHSCRLERDGIAARVFDILGDPLRFVDPRGKRSYLYSNGRLYPRPEGPLGFLRTALLPFKARVDFLRFYAAMMRQDPNDWYDRTLEDLFHTCCANADVARFLPFLGLTVMLPYPAVVSAGEVIQFLERAQRARVKQGEPIGGTRQIVDRLRAFILAHGGEIHVSETATTLLTEGRAAVGVQTSREAYHAKHIVAAFPLFRLFGLIDEALFDPGFVRYVKNIRSSSGLSIDFVFDRPVTDIKGGILGVDLPLWVKFQGNTDPDATRRKWVTTWAMLFEPGAEITADLVDRTEARIKQIMEEVLPGASTRIVQQRRLVVPVLNGNVLTPAQSYPHRPGVASKDVAGLYFAGDTTQGEGCSGDIAFSSALKLAELLKKDKA